MYESAEELVDIFRNNYPLSIFVVASFLFLISPAQSATDFSVYRMQQFDLQGNSHGSRNALMNVEARSLSASVYSRKCVVTRLKELGASKFKEVIQQNAGGLLILLPSNLDQLSHEDQEHLVELEMQLLSEEVQTPVYFAYESPKIAKIYEDIKSSGNVDNANSAFEAIISSTNLNGFQMVVGAPHAKAMNNFEITNIHGRLQGHGMEDHLPTILIVAHYDAFSAVPSLSMGADSDASGVASLLELARLFSKIYQNSKSHARYNIEFLLSGGGKFNFIGTKRWLEDQIENGELGKVSTVVCIDTVGTKGKLHAFLSKPPKPGVITDLIIKSLASVSEQLSTQSNSTTLPTTPPTPLSDPPTTVEMVHKKINLAEEQLAWEHERFSLQRMSAFTLSRLSSHKAYSRKSLVDTRSKVDIDALTLNTAILAEALAQQVFNLSSHNSQIFADELSVSKKNLASWMDFLAGQARSAQLIDSRSPLLSALEHAFHKHLRHAKRHSFKADAKEPEFVFYSGFEHTMSAYSVKPAIFDLLLALAIAAYLALLYLVSMNLGPVYSMLVRINGGKGAPGKKLQ